MSGRRHLSEDEHASLSGDGQVSSPVAGGRRTAEAEWQIGAFDLLAAQIESLKQDIDYLRAQVALLQESDALRKHRLETNKPPSHPPIRQRPVHDDGESA